MPPGRCVAPRHRVIVEVTGRAPSAGHRVGPAAQRCLERQGIDARLVTARPSIQRAQAQGLAHGEKGRHNEPWRHGSPRRAPGRGRVTLRPALPRWLLAGALAHALTRGPVSATVRPGRAHRGTAAGSALLAVIERAGSWPALAVSTGEAL